MIPVANTFIGKKEAKAAYNVVNSGWLSKGKKVAQFEKDFAEYTGAKHAIAVNSGTSALHVALAALNIGPGDEVIVPSLTFISTANVVLYQGAKLVLCDINPYTYNVTSSIIEQKITKKTKAIISVDMNGMPIDYDPIIKLAKKHKLHLIADSAESLGATYKGRKIGSIAPIHCFSFFPNKNITTGEGGMITCQDDKLAKKIRIILNQGQEGRYNHTHLGYNYRMTDIQAAIGIEQLKGLDSVIKAKQKIADMYKRLYPESKPYIPKYVTQHAWYMYTIKVKDNRDKIVEYLKDKGIETRLSFPPVHIQPYYKKRFGYKREDLLLTSLTWENLINIPIWKGLNKEDQQYIIWKLKEVI